MALTKIDDRGLKTPVDLLDNEKIRFGTGNDLEIYHDASHSYLNHTGTGHFYIYGNGVNNIYLRANSSEESIIAKTNGAVELYYDNVEKFRTTSAGVQVTGQTQLGGNTYFNYAGNGTNYFTQADGGETYFRNATGTNRTLINTSGNWKWYDSQKVMLGTGDDLQIYHDGSNSYISDNGTGKLRLTTTGTGAEIELTSQGGSEYLAQFIQDGAVKLYYDGGTYTNAKLETMATGIEVNGRIDIRGDAGSQARILFYDGDGGDDYQLRVDDSEFYVRNATDSRTEFLCKNDANASYFQLPNDVQFLQIGAGQDLDLHHNGTDSYIRNATGNLHIRPLAAEEGIILKPNADVELYYDGNIKFNTNSEGCTVTGKLWVDGLDTGDDEKLLLGESDDLQLWHDGTDSIIRNLTGETRIQCANIFEVTNYQNTETYIKASLNGAVELYHNDNKKFETRDDGVEVVGNVYCDGHYEAADNSEIRLGTHDDLKLYHDGTNNILYANLSNNYALKLWNDTATSTGYGLGVICGTDDASGTNYAITVLDGNGSDQGSITFSGGTVTYGTFTAHHPCIVPDADNPSDNSNAYPYGTLLETISIEYSKDKNGADTERGIRYKVQKTQSANSRKVLGAYGSSMNDGPNDQTNLHQALVLGDGHILCNNAGGNIEVGDGICSSAAAGIGQKATVNPSMIIGIAQEAVTFTGSETKLVAVQYGLQQFIPWT